MVLKYKISLLLIIFMIILGLTFFYKKYYLDKVINTEVESKEEDNIYEEPHGKPEITNILLLGVDEEENASDTIMILSLNEKKKTIKLVSIMRDTYIYQGEGMANKMNYAYHYGGVQGSIDTINSVFNLEISKYVKVDFEGLVNIVDYLGGVEVEISEEERKYINLQCDKSILNNSGRVNLNGNQALAYTRIRKIDSDFQRTQRQRKIMAGIFDEMKNVDMVKYPKAIYTISKSSETNLSMMELVELGEIIYKYDKSNLGELRIPIDGTSWDSSYGPYHLNWDEEVNKKTLHDFIYG